MTQLGLDKDYNEYVAKYGRENAQYIMQTIGSWQNNYKCLAYIELGMATDKEYAELAQQEAQQKQLEFHLIQGNLRLLRNLISGNWSENEFLIVQPNGEIIADDDGDILRACK